MKFHLHPRSFVAIVYLGIAIVWLSFIGVTNASDKLKLSDDFTAPRIVNGPKALLDAIKYPEEAKAQKIEGTVYVNITIDSTGIVESVKIEKGVAPILDEAAVNAVKEVKWIPAMKANRPVNISVTVPIKFQLDNDKQKHKPKKEE